MAEPVRELCSVCHRPFALTTTGKIRVHKPRGADADSLPCHGSGHPSAGAQADAAAAKAQGREAIYRSMDQPTPVDEGRPWLSPPPGMTLAEFTDRAQTWLEAELAERFRMKGGPLLPEEIQAIRRDRWAAVHRQVESPFRHPPAPQVPEHDGMTGNESATADPADLMRPVETITPIDDIAPGSDNPMFVPLQRAPAAANDWLMHAPEKPPRRKRQPLEGRAAEVAALMRETFWQYVNTQPRSQQTTIGPSEIGHECTRRLGYKLSGHEQVNHSKDSWAAFVGTQIHRGIEEMFRAADRGRGRYLIDHAVSLRSWTVPGGTLDRADRVLSMVVDDKGPGKSSLSKMWLDGPPQVYQVQLHTYGYGMELAGEPMQEVCLVAWPRESGNLDDLYVWVAPYDRNVAIAAISRVEELAAQIADGKLAHELPIKPGFLCGWCPYHLPESTDPRQGCSAK